nr:MAG TPA: hypothetical protein [Caudoviricetes sp.]
MLLREKILYVHNPIYYRTINNYNSFSATDWLHHVPYLYVVYRKTNYYLVQPIDCINGGIVDAHKQQVFMAIG